MGKFEFKELAFDGAYLISSFTAGDSRGEFTKYFEKDIYEAAGISFKLNETFVSTSARNVIRGLHFQLHHPQAKLVCVLKGRVWDVIVDLRTGYPTYKKWVGVELDARNHTALYIPRGFAHGFLTLTDNVNFVYKCDNYYDAEADGGISFKTPELSIDWPIEFDKAITSEKDAAQPTLAEFEKDNPFVYGEI